MAARAVRLISRADIATNTGSAKVVLAPTAHRILSRLVTNAADEDILSSLGILLQEQVGMVSNLSHLHDETKDVGIVVEENTLCDVRRKGSDVQEANQREELANSVLERCASQAPSEGGLESKACFGSHGGSRFDAMCLIQNDSVKVDGVNDALLLVNPILALEAFLLLAVDGLETVVRHHDHVEFLELTDGYSFGLLSDDPTTPNAFSKASSSSPEGPLCNAVVISEGGAVVAIPFLRDAVLAMARAGSFPLDFRDLSGSSPLEAYSSPSPSLSSPSENSSSACELSDESSSESSAAAAAISASMSMS
ncbi:hypothetical protein HG531_006623 [Fusarium graminearum]|nr:hypothetical protein HG531_006623 [Fusarium graminearum]